VEQVVPCGAANVVQCNGLSNTDVAAADAGEEEDDDDDVICLDDEPAVKQKNDSRRSAGFVACYSHFYNQRPALFILSPVDSRRGIVLVVFLVSVWCVCVRLYSVTCKFVMNIM